MKKILTQCGVAFLALLCFWLAGCGGRTGMPGNTPALSPTPHDNELTANTAQPTPAYPASDQIIQITVERIEDAKRAFGWNPLMYRSLPVGITQEMSKILMKKSRT